jgi:hypothetical protein
MPVYRLAGSRRFYPALVPTIRLTDELAARLERRGDSLDAAAIHAIGEWLDFTDASTARGSAAVDLLDQIGSSARGEAPLPGRGELSLWLTLLDRLLGSGAEND